MNSIESAILTVAESRLSCRNERADVLIYEQYKRLLDFVFLLLAYPDVSLEFDASHEQLLLQRVGSELPLTITVPPHELAVIELLVTASKLKVGLLDFHPIYFTNRTKDPIEVDRRRILLGDFIPLNAVVEQNFQEAFLFIERLGEVTEVICNSRTGGLTFFRSQGPEVVVEPEHPLHHELSQLTSGKNVNIGAVLTDPVSYHTRLGYFNTRTGRRLTGEQLAAAKLEPRRFELITEFLQGKKVGTTASEHLVLEDLEVGTAVPVGYCAETELLMYSQTGGIYQQCMPRYRERYFRELQPHISQERMKVLLAPGNHIYLDAENPTQLFCVDLNGTVTRVAEDESYFRALQGLARGAVGILLKNIPDSNERTLYTVVHSEHDGLIYDCQPGTFRTQAEADTYISQTSLAGEESPVFFNVLTVQSTKSHGATHAQKQRAEQASLPRK